MTRRRPYDYDGIESREADRARVDARARDLIEPLRQQYQRELEKLRFPKLAHASRHKAKPIECAEPIAGAAFVSSVSLELR